MAKKKVTIIEHTWLDCSVSWFLAIDGVKQRGEFTTKASVVEGGEDLAEAIGGVFENKGTKTNELFA